MNILFELFVSVLTISLLFMGIANITEFICKEGNENLENLN